MRLLVRFQRGIVRGRKVTQNVMCCIVCYG
nr:MAG TPA: hypothetical protein [Caudoviricetes sp.]